MRVPLPLVILLVLATVGGVWFWNTRKMDFMSPPSEARLEFIRVRTESSFPRADQTDDAISVPVVETPEAPPPEPPKPEVDLGNLAEPPTLQLYGERSVQGAGPLIELAQALEAKGEFQRALLAWERVMDLGKADDSQMATALSAVVRLRPTLPDWNLKPETAIQIQLQAGTGKTQAKALKPILEAVGKDLEVASSGIIKVTPVITAGKNSPGKGAVPVALWLTGMDKKSPTTEVLSFTTDKPETLKDEVTRTVFQLVRGYLAKGTAYTPPAGLAEGDLPLEALSYRVTRLCWSEFATSLNLKPEPPPAPPEAEKPKSSKPKSSPSKPKASKPR